MLESKRIVEDTALMLQAASRYGNGSFKDVIWKLTCMLFSSRKIW